MGCILANDSDTTAARRRRPTTLWKPALLTVLVATGSASAQGSGGDAADRLRGEIRGLEQRVKKGEAGRQGAVEQLQDLDRKIELRRQLIVELERNADESNARVTDLGLQVARVEREIETLSAELFIEETNLSKLRRDVGARAVYFYKRMAGARLAMLVGTRDLNDLAQRRRYIAAVQQFDQRSLTQLAHQRDKVQSAREQREILRQKLALDQARRLSELERYRLLIRDRRAEESAQLKERSDKQTLLRRIEGDNSLLQALLDERRQALEEIEREIARLEQNAKRSTSPDLPPGTPFKELAGRLVPPLARLDVSQPFGPSRHPKLGTVTVNPGIDLRASPGEPVRAAAGGQVTRITWLRGFGTTVIIAHGEGFYTVYARLEGIAVGEGSVVKAGQVIGEAGDTGGSSGFHFEVWSRREKQDPMKWLER